MRSHGYKPLGRRYPETSVGWYRREFDIPASDLGRRIWVEFDGVFRDVLVFVNGCFIGRNNNGYAPFRFDLTDFLAYGSKNYIVLRVDASFGDGWFYEGAGIYRHVWLTKTDAVHLGKWDSTVRSTVNGEFGNIGARDGGAERKQAGRGRQGDAGRFSMPRARWLRRPKSPAQSVAGRTVPPLQRHGATLSNPALWSRR